MKFGFLQTTFANNFCNYNSQNHSLIHFRTEIFKKITNNTFAQKKNPSKQFTWKIFLLTQVKSCMYVKYC